MCLISSLVSAGRFGKEERLDRVGGVTGTDRHSTSDNCRLSKDSYRSVKFIINVSSIKPPLISTFSSKARHGQPGMLPLVFVLAQTKLDHDHRQRTTRLRHAIIVIDDVLALTMVEDLDRSHQVESCSSGGVPVPSM